MTEKRETYRLSVQTSGSLVLNGRREFREDDPAVGGGTSGGARYRQRGKHRTYGAVSRLDDTPGSMFSTWLR